MAEQKAIIEGQSELASRIGMYRPKFNASQNRIADFLLADEEACRGMSIYEMAEKIGTSVATVTRFCQFIGYSGLADMKFHMQQQAVTLGRDIGIVRGDSANVIKQKALQYTENLLRSCLMDLDNDMLDRAAEVLGNADRVMLCAVGSGGGVAKTGVGLLMNMGINALAVDDTLVQLRAAANLTGRDVLIAISYDGMAKSTGDAMMIAKKGGAHTILITSMQGTLLSKYADQVLYTPARVGGNAMNIAGTALCQLGVLQVLMLCAVTKYYDRFSWRSERQLKLSELNRYDTKVKEIRMARVRPEGGEEE